jgi:hypothetical protein
LPIERIVRGVTGDELKVEEPWGRRIRQGVVNRKMTGPHGRR